jgi:hypothetical protein
MHFAGASGIAFPTLGTATTSGSYSTPTPTGAQPPTAPEPAQPQPEAVVPEGRIADWLSTEEARRHEGTWVLLDDKLHVIDSAISPSDLLTRHPEEASPTVVFVEPSGTQLAV